MASDQPRMMVAVFDTQDRAESTVAALRAGGFEDDQVAIVAPGDYPLGVAEALEACDIAEEEAAYYASEVDRGRLLVVVRAHPFDAGAVIAVFGRNCGCVRVPPDA